MLPNFKRFQSSSLWFMCQHQDLQNQSFKSAFRGVLTLNLMLHPQLCTDFFLLRYLIPVVLKHTIVATENSIKKGGRKAPNQQNSPELLSWSSPVAPAPRHSPGASKRHIENTFLSLLHPSLVLPQSFQLQGMLSPTICSFSSVTSLCLSAALPCLLVADPCGFDTISPHPSLQPQCRPPSCVSWPYAACF